MDLAILEAIKYMKQIIKKKVSLKNISQRINKTNATNIDIATLKIEFSSKHRKRTEFVKRSWAASPLFPLCTRTLLFGTIHHTTLGKSF